MAKPIEADVVLSCSESLPAVDVWLVIDVLRAMRPIGPGPVMSGGVMPTLERPGEMMPGQLGPMICAPRSAA